MRLIGAGIVWICIVYAGYSTSKRFVLRKELYSDFVLLVESISNEIKYYSKPITDIVLSNSYYVDKKLMDKLVDKINTGNDFPFAWKASVTEADLPLSALEKGKLIDMILSLGKSDSDIQINILNSYKAHFIKMAENAEIKCNKYSVSIFVSSILLGGSVFLVLI